MYILAIISHSLLGTGCSAVLIGTNQFVDVYIKIFVLYIQIMYLFNNYTYHNDKHIRPTTLHKICYDVHLRIHENHSA